MSDWIQSLLMLALGFGLGWITRFGMRRGIKEARFRSDTGKEIK